VNYVTTLNQNGSASATEILLLQSLSPAAPDWGAPHCSEMQGEIPPADTGSHSEVDCAELKGIPTSCYGSNFVLCRFLMNPS
jgi:hypothetical protein